VKVPLARLWIDSLSSHLLPDPPPGIVYLRSPDDVLASRDLDAYQHLLLRAWNKLELSGVLVIRGIPTVYIREDDQELTPDAVAALHRQFWNQGVATLLVLVDRQKTRIFSSMVAPQKPTASQGNQPLAAFVEEIDLATQALRAHRSDATEAFQTLCRQVASGHYYRRPEHLKKFNPRETVDAYLLNNLAAVRDELTLGRGKLDVQTAHAFLGRLLFTCYLIDRGIIELKNYFPGKSWINLQGLLASGAPEEVFTNLYGTLFPKLKREFNGSMFDDDLETERDAIRPQHLKAVAAFFAGDEIRRNQRALGFWAYDFEFVPVETISAIYENFLEKESENEKRKEGAYYTPRFLAEMTLDLATEGRGWLSHKRCLDPSCGSGIFLVLLFNRLAAQWSAENPSDEFKSAQAGYSAKDKALRAMLCKLRGVDKNLTACRIACFSLYLAFLDQFSPNDVRVYIQQSDTGKLPNLLKFAEGRGRKVDVPVIWEGDFFTLAKVWEKNDAERFDYIVGNPPWAGRGKKQIAHEFEKLAGADQIAGHFDVGFAGCRVTRRVVVNQDNCRRSPADRRREHFSCMDQDGVQRALGNVLHADQAPSRVEKNHLEVFHRVGAIGFAKNIGDTFRRVHQWRFGMRFAGQSLCQQEGGLDRCGF
jgi:hypothetical protein